MTYLEEDTDAGKVRGRSEGARTIPPIPRIIITRLQNLKSAVLTYYKAKPQITATKALANVC